MKRNVGLFATLVALCLATSNAVHAQAEEPGPRDAHKVLQLSTAGAMIITASMGTIAAINQPTLFSEGRCAAGKPIFGDYGCHGWSTLHGLMALLTSVLYTATITLEFAAFDWPGRDRHDSAYEAASYVHLVGMALQPIGGLLAAVPEVVGAERNGTFSRVLRTIHLFTGYAIVGTFVATAAIEL
jgi:hypothetical protein